MTNLKTITKIAILSLSMSMVGCANNKANSLNSKKTTSKPVINENTITELNQSEKQRQQVKNLIIQKINIPAYIKISNRLNHDDNDFQKCINDEVLQHKIIHEITTKVVTKINKLTNAQVDKYTQLQETKQSQLFEKYYIMISDVADFKIKNKTFSQQEVQHKFLNSLTKIENADLFYSLFLPNDELRNYLFPMNSKGNYQLLKDMKETIENNCN